MISVNRVTVCFSGSDLFHEISLQISDNERVGLVGKNGAGKTTLLRLISGELQPASGNVVLPKDLRLGYLPQQMKLASGHTVFDEALLAFSQTNRIKDEIDRLGEAIAKRTDYHSSDYLGLINKLAELNDQFALLDGATAHAQAEQTLLGLGFRRNDFARPTDEFSGGWRMRIELAKILLRKPQALLLDEPTNHLDIESIQWLEDYLKTYNGALLLISHDRAFLDNVTTRTVEISLGKLYDYRVPYSKYVILHRERREQQLAAYRNQQKMIEDTQDFIERFRYKPTKAVQVQSRIKMLEKLSVIQVEEEDTAAMNIKFPPAQRSGDVVCEVKDVAKSFGNHLIFSNVHFSIQRGQKVAFVGKNGEGKTTMSRILIGELPHNSGTVKIGHNVSIGYFAQNQDEILNNDLTVFETIDRAAVGDIRTRMRDILGAFLFRGDDIDKKVKVLSGGERNRLALTKLMLEPHNLLVLDEPTNHLDMRSKDVLKNALRQFDGTLIVVSHDRDFLDGLVEKIYEFSDGSVREHLGGIYDFLRRRKLDSLKELEIRQSVDLKDDKENSSQKISYEERKEIDRKIRRAQTAVSRVERAIEEHEQLVARTVAILADPEAHGVNLADAACYNDYETAKRELAELMEQWEVLQTELDALTHEKSIRLNT